jgi:hypothetical protein
MSFTTQSGDGRDHLVADIPILGSRFPKTESSAARPKRRSTKRSPKPTAEKPPLES